MKQEDSPARGNGVCEGLEAWPASVRGWKCCGMVAAAASTEATPRWGLSSGNLHHLGASPWFLTPNPVSPDLLRPVGMSGWGQTVLA